ncbi:MAG: GIY-YIG nuclease family protein [Magnetococcales bacterium]|nr:GIY-YIG nuclease family protein [Magnetococcales bacterium]
MPTYALLIKYTKSQHVKVGAKGYIDIKAGSYLYIGSAKKSWEKRVGRHLKKEKKLRWHIDYLLSTKSTSIEEVWINQNSCECETAKAIADLKNSAVVAKKIGSSDCRCPTHFFYIKNGFTNVKELLNKLIFATVKIEKNSITLNSTADDNHNS